jgi:hypothetical protein
MDIGRYPSEPACSLFPIPYQLKEWGIAVQQEVIVNWLKNEAISAEVQRQYPVLQEIRGWRSQECYEAVRAFDWTARMYEA